MKKGIMFILVLMILLSLVFSGCGKQPADTDTKADPTATPASTPADNGNGDNGGDEGTLPVSKITDEKITLKFARLGFTDVRPPAGELWMWKRYEEMTNIHIEWEEIPPAGFAERKNIMMAASDLPDAFYQAIFSNEEIGKYGSQGTFIKLNDLIAQYGPNINKLMQKDETVRKAMTMPDGNIYSLPYTQQDYDAANLRYYINQEWLANLGLNMPTSIEELSNILRAFKEQDANGNGDPNDEYPIYFIAPTMIEQQLLGSFGLGNRGLQGMNALIDMGPDGKVRFFPTDPKYKEVWQLMNDWWEAGYWHPETWSGIDYARWVADGSENKVGLFSWVTPKYIGADTAEKYWGINALKGPDGDAIQTWQDPLVRGIWSFMITNKNQYPVETMKWVDFFYSPAGTEFGAMGEEGVTFTRDANGNPKYIDEIVNYEGGQQLGAFQWVDNVYGGYYPFIDLDIETTCALSGITFEENYRVAKGDSEKYRLDEIWAQFNATPEESEEIIALLTDINVYIHEMRVKFITGEADLDAEWDTYVETLKRMGADRYLEIKQQQYERYNK